MRLSAYGDDDLNPRPPLPFLSGMPHPSFAPAAALDYSDDLLETLSAPRSTKMRTRLSLVPPMASATTQLPMVEETFRKMHTLPPGSCSNDEDDLSEDELFAIWSAHLC